MFRIATLTRAAAALVLALTLAACTDAPAPTSAAPSTSLLGGSPPGLTGTVSGLLACDVRKQHSASKTIGASGGVLKIGPHTFTVPKGALSRDVTISAVAPRGRSVKVEFQPEGLQFEQPTALTLSYESCGTLSTPLVLKVVYLGHGNGILEVLPSAVNLQSKTVTGKLGHFSNYAIAE